MRYVFILLLTACSEPIQIPDETTCFYEKEATAFYEKCLADTGLPEHCEYETDKAFCGV